MKRKNNAAVIVLLIAVMIIIFFSIFDKLLFLDSMQFDEQLKYPEIEATVMGANIVCGVIVYLIGVNISESKKKLKILIKAYGILNIVIPAIITLILLSRI